MDDFELDSKYIHDILTGEKDSWNDREELIEPWSYPLFMNQRGKKIPIEAQNLQTKLISITESVSGCGEENLFFGEWMNKDD